MPRSPLPFFDGVNGFDVLVEATLQRLDHAIVPAESAQPSDSGPDDELVSIVEESKRHPANFRKHLIRNNGGKVERIGANLDEWQRADFEAMDDAWLYAAGLSQKRPQKRRAYLERPRGHSKTTDEAIMACWIVMAAPTLMRGYACAAGEEQAKLLIQAADKIVTDNPWLGELIEVLADSIVNRETGSICQVVPAKANTNFGHVPNFVICDELTHWQHKSVWTAIFSGLYKVPTSVMVVISNAGYGKGRSWQWKLRELCRIDPAWYFNSLKGQQASWLTAEDIDEQRRLLNDDDEFRRLIENRWLSDTKGGIPHAQVIACTSLSGPVRLRPATIGHVIAALDIGIVRHRTSLVAVGIDLGRRKTDLLYHKTWRPSEFPRGKVDLATVEAEILQLHKNMTIDELHADDFQAARSLQTLSEHFNCFEVHFGSSKVLKQMGRTFVEAFTNQWLRLFYDPVLESDILAIEIERNERTKSQTLSAEEDETGHADSAFALAIALMVADIRLPELLAGDFRESKDEEVDIR